MGADITAMDNLSEAVKKFWKTRAEAAQSQKKRGKSDQGARSSVTAGKNLDGISEIVRQIVQDNGIREVDIYTEGKSDVTLPGFYRPTKNWDLLVVSGDQLLAAVEFKSQVGPSFGNNFNNRVEESLGNAIDLNTAFREGVFGESQKPFMGYFFVLEECEKSMAAVRFTSPHFPAMPEFEDTSYAQRYEILCRKLIQEQLYDAACLVMTPKKGGLTTGEHRCLSDLTSAKRFAATLAGKMSAMSV